MTSATMIDQESTVLLTALLLNSEMDGDDVPWMNATSTHVRHTALATQLTTLLAGVGLAAAVDDLGYLRISGPRSLLLPAIEAQFRG